MGGPAEKHEEQSHGVVSLQDPQPVDLVVARHLCEVVFHEIIDVLAEDVHVGFKEN